MTQYKKEVRTYIKLNRRLEISNAGLEKRKLINVQKHEHCDGVAGISLTIEGCDLGENIALGGHVVVFGLQNIKITGFGL